MNRFMKFIGVGCISLSLTVSCAEFGVWKDSTQQKLNQIDNWAKDWIGGSIKKLPLIIELASMVPGSNPYINDLNKSINIANNIVESFDSLVKSGDSSIDDIQKTKEITNSFNNIKEIIQNLKDMGVKID